MSARSLHILHTEWSSGWGGQEIRVLGESQAMRARGHTVELAVREGGQMADRARAAGFVVHAVPFRHAGDLGSILRIRRILRDGRFDVVHTHSSVDGWCGGIAGRLAGVPVVRSRHLSSALKWGPGTRIVYRWLAQRVIASGRDIRRQLIQGLGLSPDCVVSIPAGADESRFRPGLDRWTVRRSLGVPDGAYVVGIVAVLRSWKGHGVLLEAIHRLGLPADDLRLLIAGEGPLRANLEQRVQEMNLEGQVHFLGHRTDVPEVMAGLDVLVLPSLKNEATSQVIPQAMLVGTPVIASTAGGLTEVVEDGVTGLGVPPGDAGALAEAITRCRNAPAAARERAARAREYALRELTFERMIERTEGVYFDVVAAERRVGTAGRNAGV